MDGGSGHTSAHLHHKSLNNKYLLSVIFSECKGEDRVIQPTEDVFASEGDTVTLDCKFETTDTTPSLFWYRQEMDDFPKYLWKSYGSFSGNAPGISDDRFKAAKNGTSVPLKIQKLQLTDSVVYYCAVKPTVTGNTTTQHKMELWLWIILAALLFGEKL
uniref:Ig-like domain-containing protein n=1 Tax=Labrus bergylta TaxID=56723 RepID=A0A3Q3FD71_9LABR